MQIRGESHADSPITVVICRSWLAMNIHDFERIVKTEKSVMRYLAGLCKEAGKLFCPTCRNYKLYKIENGKRRRCSKCGYTFHLLTGRWLNRVRINIRDWLWIIKLFELETSASVIAEETGISYPTVLKAVDTIRMSIVSSDGGLPIGGNTIEKIPSLGTVFGIYADSEGITRIIPLPDDCVLYATKIEQSYLVFTERSVTQTSLLIRNHKLTIADYGKNFPRCRVYSDCEGFWPFAKERLIKHHGVSFNKLPLYLKESEFRWINGNSHIFEALIERLCSFMPDQHAPGEKSRIAV